MKPVFVVAPPHSGTTILYKMLGKHPAITWFSQYSMRSSEIPGRLDLPFSNAIDRFLRQHFSYSWDKKNKGRSVIIPRPSEPHKIWDYLLPDEKEFFTADDYDERQAQEMRHFVQKECKIHDKDVLVTKLPRLSRAVDLLKEVFSDAYFVHIIRDGRAVALSNRHKFARHTDSDIQALKDSAGYWQKVVHYIEDSLSEEADRYSMLRYEDFCADVPSMLQDIMSDINVNPGGYNSDNIPDSLTVTNNKHFKRASREEEALLNSTLEDTLKRHDYNTFSLSN